MRRQNRIARGLRALLFSGVFALGGLAAFPAAADRISHPVSVFAGLDKITGRIIAFEVSIDETVQFGSLQITPRVCYTRPQTEAPQTTGFIEVDEIQEDRKFKRIFSGWMFAASPGLHGVEHPVYDVWLTDCKGGTEVIVTTPATPEDNDPPPNADVSGRKPPAKPKEPRRRVDPGSAGGQAPVGGQAPAGGQAPSPPTPQPDTPRRAPSQRFFPNDRGAAPDPAGR